MSPAGKGRGAGARGARRGGKRPGANGPGLLIVFEGLDGCGKTTQAHRLVERLKGMRGVSVALGQEPGGTPGGLSLRSLLLAHPQSGGWQPWSQALLFFAARHENVVRKVRPALQEGKIFVLDRFTHSTLAYQGAGEKIPFEDLEEVARLSADGIVPDLLLIIKVPVERSIRRIRERARTTGDSDPYERKRKPYLKRVAAGFERFESSENRKGAARARRFAVIDGDRHPDLVEEDVKREVEKLLRARGWLKQGRGI